MIQLVSVKRLFSKHKTLQEKLGRGFTLIELLVVIAIIAVLVGIVVVAIDPVALIGRSNDTKDRSDSQQLKNAMQLYFNDNNVYPPTGTWVSELEPDYMRDVDAVRFSYDLLAVSGEYRVGVVLDQPTADDLTTTTVCSIPAGDTAPGWWEDPNTELTALYVVCPD